MNKITVDKITNSYRQALNKAQEAYRGVLNVQPKPAPLPFQPPPENLPAFSPGPVLDRDWQRGMKF